MREERIDTNMKSSGEDFGEKAAYQAPEVSVSALRLVTLGGTPGNGDSGAPTSENDFGSSGITPPDEQIGQPPGPPVG